MIYLIDKNLNNSTHSFRMRYIINNIAKADIEHIPIDEVTDENELLYIIQNLIDRVEQTDIIYCPWSIPTKNIDIDKIMINLAKKCYVVAAAGNSGKSIDEFFFPARVDGVHVIGALNKSLQKAKFSNYSKTKKLYWIVGTNYNIAGELESGSCVSGSIFVGMLYNLINTKQDLTKIDDLINKYNAENFIDG